MDYSGGSTTGQFSPAVDGGRPAVSFGREAVAAVIMIVMWGVVTPGVNLVLGERLISYGDGFFVDAFALLVCALVIGLLGATGRRWIAVLPALMALHQVVSAVSADAGVSLYGWLYVNPYVFSEFHLPQLGMYDYSVILGITFVAWAYGFGRRPWGLVIAGVCAMFLCAVHVVIVVVVFHSAPTDFFEAVLVYSSIAVIFLLAVASAHLGGRSALGVDGAGQVIDPDSGPRGGTIAAVFGLVALLHILLLASPFLVSEYLQLVLVTLLVVGAVIAARERRLPVAIVGAVLWLYCFLWGALPALVDQTPTAGGWSWFYSLFYDLPSFLYSIVVLGTSVIPLLVGIALIWALLRCRVTSRALLATGIVTVVLVLVWALYTTARWLVFDYLEVFGLPDLRNTVYFVAGGFGYALAWAASAITIGVVVHLFRGARAPSAAAGGPAPVTPPTQTPAPAAQTQAQVRGQALQGEWARQGAGASPGRPTHVYPRTVGYTFPDD